jgi:hypothetical protein
MRHLTLANRWQPIRRPAGKSPDSDMCLVDYAHCPTSDVCWLIDVGSGCDAHDGCIIDTN